MPYFEVSPDRDPYDNLTAIIATTAFPGREHENIRQEYIRVMKGVSISRIITEYGLDERTSDSILFQCTGESYHRLRDPDTIEGLCSTGLHRSLISGKLLIALYSYRKKSDSLSKRMSELMVAKLGGGNKTYVRNWWATYKSVSPFAAALRLLHIPCSYVDDLHDSEVASIVEDTLSLGEALRCFGEMNKFNPDGKELEKRNILDAKLTWKAPRNMIQNNIQHIEIEHDAFDEFERVRKIVLKEEEQKSKEAQEAKVARKNSKAQGRAHT